MISLRTTSQAADAAKFIADAISGKLNAGKSVLFFVPGGSAISVAVHVADLLKNTPCEKLTVMQTDERYGPIGHQDSNWRQMLEKSFVLPQAILVPVLSGKNFTDTVSEFNQNLGKELADSDFKIGLFGIGKDGHTAGILPQSGAVNSQAWAFGYQTPTFTRITMTPRAIARLDQAVIWAQGVDKWPVLENLRKSVNIDKQPAQALKKVPKLTIFSDYKINF